MNTNDSIVKQDIIIRQGGKYMMPVLETGTPQFFFDNVWIAHQQRLVRRWLSAEVYLEPALRPDRPWEERCLTLFGSVLPNPDGGYRMYYSTFNPYHSHAQLLLMATSADGLRWEKPELGLVEYRGSRKNNIVLAPEYRMDSPSLIYDPEDTEYPYKMACCQNTALDRSGWGMQAYVSRDGFAWEQIPGTRVRLGDRNSLYRDPADGRYVFLSRDPAYFNTAGGRQISRSDSADFFTWTEPEFIMAADLADEPDIEFYGMPVFARHGWYLGLLEYWDASRDFFEVHLAVSRDGKAWQRPLPRRPFIAPTYDWNRAWTSCANNGPISEHEQLIFYFGGRNVSHGCNAASLHGVIGYAHMPLDHFCALEATAGGEFTTPPFIWPGGDLALNADTRESFSSHPAHTNGVISIEVLDAQGEVVPDWGGDVKACYQGNTYARRGMRSPLVLWPGDRSLNLLAGTTIRLRFVLRHARLFTFEARSE